jgi:hypothetical protein
MKTQNLIKQTLSQPESVVVVQQILEDNKEAPRSAIAKRVCQHFGFFKAWGRAQKSGCLKALRELERVGRFKLPPSQRPCPPTAPRRLTEPVEAPRELPSTADQIQELELIRVESDSEVRIWNELMIQEAPPRGGSVGGCPNALPDSLGTGLARGLGV